MTQTRTFRPTAYIPTMGMSGDVASEHLLLRGEGMWLRSSRAGIPYAEGYTGNLNLSENIATLTLTGTITWTSSSTTVSGSGTAFVTEIKPGCFVFGDGGAGATELFVVEKVISNTSFICCYAPKASGSGKNAYVMPVLFPVGTDRGTAIWGNVLQFPTGHYLGVGNGTFRVNGTALSSTLALSATPQFALFNPAAGTYTQDDVGIDKPTTPITLTAVAIDATITGATNATPIVITVAGIHGLYNGQEGVVITGVGGNTAANGTWTITRLTAATFSLNTSVGNGAYTAGGAIAGAVSQMRAGGYNVRICNKSTSTKGFSQPSDVIAPLALTAGQAIQITFNSAMLTDQNAYDIYVTPFEDNSTTTIEARYMGPWFLIMGTATSPDASVVAADLIDGSHATGRETGTTFIFSYADAEISTATQLLTFNNFPPVDAGFVDLINGIPIYFSCLGKGTTTKLNGTTPGPAAIPSKPSNPEAIFTNKAITTAGGDYILGEFNAKSRVYVLCQESLQTLLLTTLEEEPITFRSLWKTGFRNPYNVAFIKEYLYGDSTQGIVRSVAGGDDSTIEFEFASDMRDIFVNEPCGHKLVAYDPKNKAVCFFYAAAERRSGYWVTIVRPFLIEKGIWNPPIVLKKTNTDFIVSAVATIGSQLVFLAGGRKSDGSIEVGTYVFDGGDSETKTWYLAWAYSDSGAPVADKEIVGFSTIGLFASASTRVDLHGIIHDGAFAIETLVDNTGSKNNYTVGTLSSFGRKRFRFTKWSPFSLWTMRMSGSYTTTADRLDKLEVAYNVIPGTGE